MVALAGQLSGWPVPDNAGISTPVSVTTNQSVETPGGDSFKLLSEISSCWQSLPRFTLNLYGASIPARNAAITRLLLQANPKPVLNYPTHLVSFLPGLLRQIALRLTTGIFRGRNVKYELALRFSARTGRFIGRLSWVPACYVLIENDDLFLLDSNGGEVEFFPSLNDEQAEDWFVI